MDSADGLQTSLWRGCPIRNLRAQRSHAAPPERFAGLRVLHRHSAPRHPPRTHACLWHLGRLRCLRRLPHVPSAVFSACLGKIEVIVIYFCNAVVNVRCEANPDNWKVENSQRLQYRYPRPQQLLSSKPLPAARCSTSKCRDGTLHPALLPRKEVIQPHLPVRLPCYDFTPITDPTLDACLPCGLAQRLQVLPTFVV